MTMDAEATETYLRLLAETELYRDTLSRSYWTEPSVQGRLRIVTEALLTIDAIDPQVIRCISTDMRAARSLRDTRGFSPHLQQWIQSASMSWARPSPMRSSPPAPPRPAPARGHPLAALAGRMLRLDEADELAHLWLLGVVRAPPGLVHYPHSTDFALAVVTQRTTTDIPSRLWPDQALDDQGNTYEVRHYDYSGDGGGLHDPVAIPSAWLYLDPPPADDVRWIDLYGHPDAPRVRMDLTAEPTSARVSVTAAEPASPAERLLDAIAVNILTRGHEPGIREVRDALDEIVAALQAANTLPPDSPALRRLAIISQGASLDVLPGLAIALAGKPPGAELPGPWISVLAHMARRHKRAVSVAAAPLAVVLPELDGIAFALAGLLTTAEHSLLSVIATGLPMDSRGASLGAQWGQWFPWWIRDSGGQWHIAYLGGSFPYSEGPIHMHLRVNPPLPDSVTSLDVIITGKSARITATIPTDWARS